MAVAIVVEFPGVTQDRYDKVQKALGLEGPETWGPGLILHLAGPTTNGWKVVDVWESRDQFDRFVTERLGKALREAGMPEPHPQEFPVYNLQQRVIGAGSKQKAA